MAATWIKILELKSKPIILKLLSVVLKSKTISFPLNPNNVQSILLLRYDRLGDMVVTLPLIEYLKQQLPHCSIDIAASPRNIELLEEDDRINRRFIINGVTSSFQIILHAFKIRFSYITSTLSNCSKS